MKKIKSVLIFIIASAIFCSCGATEIPPENEPVFISSESEAPSKEKNEYTEEDYDAVVKELGYTEEQLIYLEGFIDEGLSTLAVMEPLKYSKVIGETTWPEGMEYSLGSFFFDPEFYGDYGGPLGFVYIRKNGKMKILPEIPSNFTKWGVVDSEHFYLGDYGEIRIYNINNIYEPSSVWSVPEEKLVNKEWRPILTSVSSERNGEIIVIWVNRPEDFDAPQRGQNLDSTNYMITVLDTEGKVIGEYDTGIKIKLNQGGLSNVMPPEIVAAAKEKILFKVNNLHYVFDYKAENPVGKQYIFTEDDIVQYSNIDFRSEFAEDAITAVTDYITKSRSGNTEYERFYVRAEIDENATTREINLTGGILKGRYVPEDYLNGFLVIRTEVTEFYSDESIVQDYFKYYVLYDPENKYEGKRTLGETGWKIIGGSKESFEASEFDDERFYIYFEEGKIG